MDEKKGFLGKLFGKKSGFESNSNDIPRRIEARKVEEEKEDDLPGKMLRQARKFREEREMNEPLIKRKRY